MMCSVATSGVPQYVEKMHHHHQLAARCYVYSYKTFRKSTFLENSKTDFDFAYCGICYGVLQIQIPIRPRLAVKSPHVDEITKNSHGKTPYVRT